VSFLSHRIKRLEDSRFKLLFRGDFSNASIRSISLVVLLTPFCISAAILRSVLRADSLSIASRSWPR
jgi:hypothetical protein